MIIIGKRHIPDQLLINVTRRPILGLCFCGTHLLPIIIKYITHLIINIPINY